MKEVLKELLFPVEAQKEILYCYELLADNREFQDLLKSAEQAYRKNGTLDYEKMSAEAGALSEKTGVKGSIGSLLFFLSLCPAAKNFYDKKGLGRALYLDTFYDLTMKAAECKKLQGIWGTTTSWFGRFFDLTRFKFSRLEFEGYEISFDYMNFKKGDKGVNIHIPEDGPLCRDQCLASYRMASEFYHKLQKDGKILFMCSSWLLAEEIAEFMPAQSNILKFAADFDIISVRKEKGFPDGWRVFGADYTKSPDQLPRSTSLQRGYADYLVSHEFTSVPLGAFLYDLQSHRIIRR